LFIGNKPTNKQKNTSSSNIQKEGDQLNSNATHTWKKKTMMFLLQKTWSCAKELQQANCCRKGETK
jgi:hypothetical protein